MAIVIGSLMIVPFILAVGAGLVSNELEIANQ
jgi:hypothetical protein